MTEVIVATSILLIVFAIALTTLNTIMVGSVQKDTAVLETKAQELIYQYLNNQIKIPLSYREDDLTIQITKIKKAETDWIAFEVQNEKTNKRIKRIIISNEIE